MKPLSCDEICFKKTKARKFDPARQSQSNRVQYCGVNATDVEIEIPISERNSTLIGTARPIGP